MTQTPSAAHRTRYDADPARPPRPVLHDGPEIAKADDTKAMMSESIRMRSWIDRHEGRKAFIKGTMHQGDRLCAEAQGIFIQPKISMLEHAMTSSTEKAPND